MTESLIRQVWHALPADAWPEDGHPLIIGVSGGGDSIALAHLLDHLNRQDDHDWSLVIAHVDHCLRGAESTADARFVEDLAQRRGWTFRLDRCDVQRLSRESGRSLEDAARQARYAFFERVLDDTGGAVVATAHTADDNAETILHRFLRGTGLRGLAGIPAVRPIGHGSSRRIIRPILTLTAARLGAWRQDTGLDHREDASNLSLEPTRNRIRRQLLPQLTADYNPQLTEGLLRLGQQCRWWNEYLDGVLEKLFGDVALEIGREHAVLSASALCKLPEIMRTEVIRRATVVIGARQRHLSFRHVTAIAEFAMRNVSGKKLELPDGLRVSRKRDQLRFNVSPSEREES